MLSDLIADLLTIKTDRTNAGSDNTKKPRLSLQAVQRGGNHDDKRSTRRLRCDDDDDDELRTLDLIRREFASRRSYDADIVVVGDDEIEEHFLASSLASTATTTTAAANTLVGAEDCDPFPDVCVVGAFEQFVSQ